MYKFSLCLIIFVAIFGPGLSYKPCIEYKSVEVDAKALLAVEKFHVIQHSGCTTCENDEDWKWIMGRSKPKEICMTAQVKIHGETYTLNLRCEYAETDFSTQSCLLDTSNLKGDQKTIGMKGIKKFAGTNNKNWWALSVCVYGKEQWWMVVSSEPTISDADKKAALDSLDNLGFDTKATDKGIVQFETFDFSEC